MTSLFGLKRNFRASLFLFELNNNSFVHALKVQSVLVLKSHQIFNLAANILIRVLLMVA
jgi:hypothetical protein